MKKTHEWTDDYQMRNKSIEQVRQILYVQSPFDLASTKDDAYRDGVDTAIEAFNKWMFDNEI